MRRRDDRYSAATQLWIPRHIRTPLGRPSIRWGYSLSERNTIREPRNRRSVIKYWTTVAKDIYIYIYIGIFYNYIRFKVHVSHCLSLSLSLLGPLLFALYISDIGQHNAFSNYHIFADDLEIYLSCKPDEIDSATSKVNSDIDAICRWAEGRNLNINIGKTKTIMFGSRVYLNNIAMFPSLLLYMEMSLNFRIV